MEPTGEIRGTVLSGEDGTPLPGVFLGLSPGDRSTVTDAEGQYAFSDLAVGVSYQLTARRDDYADLTTTLELAEEDNPLTIDLSMPPFSRINPPVGDLRVWTDVTNGFGLDDPSMTFRLRLENLGMEALTEVTINDSITAGWDGYQLKLEDFSIDREAFPDAQLEIAANGRSFMVSIDELVPTTSLVELLRFTVPTPSEPSVYCNLVEGTATGEGSVMRHDDSSCLAGGI